MVSKARELLGVLTASPTGRSAASWAHALCFCVMDQVRETVG